MDYDNVSGFDVRTVSDFERDGESTRIVSGSRNFATDADNLWDAVTNKARIPNWFLPISGELNLGGRYQLEGHAGGEILRCEQSKRFEVTWECSGNTSWVEVSLDSNGDSTILTLKHFIPKDEASENHWTQFGPGATGVGWELCICGLGLHIESGKTIDQADGQAWMASDPGKDFIRASAKSWGESHTAGGESIEIASAMAEQTAKAYTGEL